MCYTERNYWRCSLAHDEHAGGRSGDDPLTVHWSLEGALVTELWNKLLGTVAGAWVYISASERSLLLGGEHNWSMDLGPVGSKMTG